MMKTSPSRSRLADLAFPFVVAAVCLVGIATWSRWYPNASNLVRSIINGFRDTNALTVSHGAVDEHDAHDHHSETTSLQLSKQALLNVGIGPEDLRPIKLQSYHRSITVPAIIVERHGKTQVQVATPMTGVVTEVHAIQGEAITAGTLLFSIRLTHEDLVQAQTDFLRTVGELDVERREIRRLQSLTDTGAVAGKVLLERQYSEEKLLALMSAQREALRLHGLSDSQVDQIMSRRRLLRELKVYTPSVERTGNVSRITVAPSELVASDREEAEQVKSNDKETALILQQVDVHKGQAVLAGETLCILADYEQLFIEGLAFEQDLPQVLEALQNNWPITAHFETNETALQVIENLEIAYLASRIDPTTRTLRFYVRLPNKIRKDERSNGNRFVQWQYLPGQRLQLQIPVEQWPNQILLPVDAVARDGAEYYVFQQNGKQFDRIPVHVKYRDQQMVVIENDGSLFPGDIVAMRGAHQMQIALKNKAGGAVDPHAGHTH